MSQITEAVQFLKDYLKGSYQELQKVVWPTKQQTLRYSLAVVAISLFVASFFGILDYIFSSILGILIS